MQRIVNFRAFLFIFIGAIIGVVFSFYIIRQSLVSFILAILLILGLAIIIVVTKVIKNNKKFEFINKFLICLLIGFLVFLLLGVVSFKLFNNNLKDISSASVSARITYKSEKENYTYLILEEATIKNNETNIVENFNGRISLTVYGLDSVNSYKIGDKIIFDGTLISSNIIKDNKFNTYLYKNNIKYSSFINESASSVTSGSMKFDESVRESIKNLLFENLSYDNASIAYASIFGDKTMMDNNIYSSFSVSGVAHLLCVSGLHVGFLVALLYFLFNLVKVKKKYIFIFLAVILIIYAYLCGFSPSVVRASIMSIILAGSVCFGNLRYDNLNSLGLAGIIILLFSPFMVFDVGFQLSFASCFGIFLLMPLFIKLFKKIKFYNKFSVAFSLTLAAQIGTYPILLHNFEKLSFLSLVANIIIVPIFSIIFMLLIIFVLINLIFPAKFLFSVIELGLNAVVILTKSIGSINEMVYYTFSSKEIVNFAFYFSIILASGFINFKILTKVTSVVLCFLIIGLSFMAQFYPKNYNFSAIINSSADSFTIITNSYNEKILIVTEEFSLQDLTLLKNDLVNVQINKIDAVIMADYSSVLQNAISIICNNYDVSKIYFSNLENLEEKYLFENLKNTQIIKTETDYFSYNNFTFKIIEEIKSVQVNVIENNIVYNLFLTGNVNKAVSTYIINYSLCGDYLKAKYINKNYLLSLENFSNIICKNSTIYLSNMFNISKINDTIKIGEEIKYEV